LQNCSQLTLSRALSFWATWILYGWQCKSLWSIRRTLHSFKRSARPCRRADLRGFRNIASLTGYTLSDVRAGNGRPCGLLSLTDFSWHHFDTHNNRVLRLGASRLWNSWRKPRSVTVTDSVVINISTAAILWSTEQRSTTHPVYKPIRLNWSICRLNHSRPWRSSRQYLKIQLLPHSQQSTSAPFTKTKLLTSPADGCAQLSSLLGPLIPEKSFRYPLGRELTESQHLLRHWAAELFFIPARILTPVSLYFCPQPLPCNDKLFRLLMQDTL